MIAENPKPSKTHNLTPNQTYSLQYAIWDNRAYSLKFNTQLSVNEVNTSIFFRNTRLFLNKLLESKDKNTSTDKGNLNRAFVKVIFEEMELDEKDRISIKEYNKVINEEDVFPLHIIKIICELAGLINKRAKKIIVTEKYKNLLSDEKAGHLYYLLFETYFKKFNLGYQDRFPKLYCIQETFDFTLHRIGQVCDDYQTMKKLFDKIFLRKVKKEMRKTRTMMSGTEHLLEVRLIRPLVKFGLLDVIKKKEGHFSRVEKVKKSELFGRFVVGGV